MNEIENLPLRTLLRIVHHRRPEDEPGIALVLRLSELGVVVRQRLGHLLTRLGLTDRGFAALVALYTLDPDPVTPADLAYHIDAPRSSVGATLDQLVHSGHVERRQDPHHPATTRLQLTAAGRDLAAQTVSLVLQAAERFSRHLPRETCVAISTLCEALQAECRTTDASTPENTPFVP